MYVETSVIISFFVLSLLNCLICIASGFAGAFFVYKAKFGPERPLFGSSEVGSAGVVDDEEPSLMDSDPASLYHGVSPSSNIDFGDDIPDGTNVDRYLNTVIRGNKRFLDQKS